MVDKIQKRLSNFKMFSVGLPEREHKHGLGGLGVSGQVQRRFGG